MALVAIIFAVRSSEGAECQSATFYSEVNKTMLDAANILAEHYAQNTTNQILASIKKNSDPNVISLNLTTTTVDDVCSITYKILIACNETVITTLPDGTQQVTVVTTSVDPNQVKSQVAAG